MILQDEEKHELTLPLFIKTKRKERKQKEKSSVVHLEVQFCRSQTKGFFFCLVLSFVIFFLNVLIKRLFISLWISNFDYSPTSKYW